MSNDLNILILGESGVGKSTWINSFANYIAIPTLEEALRLPRLNWLVSGSFTVTTTLGKKLVQKEVKIGNSQYEDTTIGSSATQCCVSYFIDLSFVTIRLIDTPGFGDTRGTQQDDKNMQNILDALKHYGHIHGIIILLKPNDTRLGVTFCYVIQEILIHFHRSAARNIIFGFTNTRQTHYQPGDTLPALSKLLSDIDATDLIQLTTDTVYNFDSESFRYLAAAKKGIRLGGKNDYVTSWERSVKEVTRMIQYIYTLPPHSVDNTLRLITTRKFIMDLTKSAAGISRLITINNQLIDSHRKQIQEAKSSIKELENTLMRPQTDLQLISLNHRVTVCSNSECVEIRTSGSRIITNYKTVCHEPCRCVHVSLNTINSGKLLRCNVMRGGQYCSRCGHSYSEHMHIQHKYQEVFTQVEDSSVQQRINSLEKIKEDNRTDMEEHIKLISEYQSEQQIIKSATTELGLFLKQDSIIVFNNAKIAYLDHLIKDRENKLHISKNDDGKSESYSESSASEKKIQDLLDVLYKSKQEYTEYEFTLIARLQSSSSCSSYSSNSSSKCDGENQHPCNLSEAEKILTSLYDLKHSGKDIEESIQNTKSAFKTTLTPLKTVKFVSSSCILNPNMKDTLLSIAKVSDKISLLQWIVNQCIFRYHHDVAIIFCKKELQKLEAIYGHIHPEIAAIFEMISSIYKDRARLTSKALTRISTQDSDSNSNAHEKNFFHALFVKCSNK